MKKVTLATAAWLVATAGAAHAADLYTAPFWGGSAGNYVTCKMANVTTKDKVVRIRLLSGNGGVLNDSGDITLPAGRSDAIAGGPTLQQDVRCHFHGAGGKGGYRAIATLIDVEQPNNTNDILIIPAD